MGRYFRSGYRIRHHSFLANLILPANSRQEGGRKRKTKAAQCLFSHWVHLGASLCQLTCPQVREAEALLGGTGTSRS